MPCREKVWSVFSDCVHRATFRAARRRHPNSFIVELGTTSGFDLRELHILEHI